MIKEFVGLDARMLLRTDSDAKAMRRTVAVGAALQLAEAAVSSGSAGNIHLVENLEEYVQKIEALLDLSESSSSKP